VSRDLLHYSRAIQQVKAKYRHQHHPHIAPWIHTVFQETAPPAEMVRDSARCMGKSRAKYGVFATLGNRL